MDTPRTRLYIFIYDFFGVGIEGREAAGRVGQTEGGAGQDHPGAEGDSQRAKAGGGQPVMATFTFGK
jgi:hypothetical protein